MITPPVPDDLALLGWHWSYGLLHDPDEPISICPRSFPPPACFDIARDWAWLRARVAAEREDVERAKTAKKPKRARKRRGEPEMAQEAMGLWEK